MDFAIKTILTANDAQLKAAFGDAGSQVKKLGQKLQSEAEKATSSWRKFSTGGIFKSGITQGIGQMLGQKIFSGVEEAAKALPELGEKAKDIALSSQKLGMSSEYYQRMAYAMKSVNIPAEQMQGAFEKLNRGFAMLQKGTGPIETGLKRLDPALMASIRSSKSAGDAFKIAAEAIAKTTDPAKRAAIAQAVFGKSGQELLPILLKGADGINKVMEQASIYSDVMSDNAVAAGVSFTASLHHITGTLTALKDEALAGIMEKIAPLLDKFAEWVAKNKEIIGQKIEAVFNGIASAVDLLSKGWSSGLIPALLAGIGAFMAMQKILLLVAAAQELWNAATDGNPIGLIVMGIAALVAGFVLLATNMGGVGNAFKFLGNVIMKALLTPINLVLDGIIFLMTLISKMPGLGKIMAPGLEAVKDFQNKMNKTLTGTEGQFDYKGTYENDKASGKAPNSGVASGYNMHILNEVNVDNSRAPGTTSTVRPAKSFSDYPTTAGYAH